MNSEDKASPGLTPVCALRPRFSLHRQLLLLSTPGSLKGNGSFDLKSFYLYNLFNMEPRGRGILNCLSWTNTELKTVISCGFPSPVNIPQDLPVFQIVLLTYWWAFWPFLLLTLKMERDSLGSAQRVHPSPFCLPWTISIFRLTPESLRWGFSPILSPGLNCAEGLTASC